MLGQTEIACICWGTKYDFDYVERLFDSINRHCSYRVPFVCITDQSPAAGKNRLIEFREPPNRWYGWWQKINCFDRTFMKRRYIIFIDLDVVILKSIDPLFKFIGTADFCHAEDPLDLLSSSLMIIDTWSDFARDVIQNFDAAKWVDPETGDQDYLRLFLQPQRYRIQALPPETHYSYKCLVNYQGWANRVVNIRYGAPSFEEVTMLNFHGFPKPRDLFLHPDRWSLTSEILPHWRTEANDSLSEGFHWRNSPSVPLLPTPHAR